MIRALSLHYKFIYAAKNLLLVLYVSGTIEHFHQDFLKIKFIKEIHINIEYTQNKELFIIYIYINI